MKRRFSLGVLIITAGLSIILPSSGFSWYVKATREGLVGEVTANGHTIVANDWFVSLPSGKHLAKNNSWDIPYYTNGETPVRVRVTYNNRSIIAPVWDKGPWNINDNYWDPDEKRDIYQKCREYWWKDGQIKNRRPKSPLPPNWKDEDFPVDATHPDLYPLGQGVPEAWQAYDTSKIYTPSSYNYGCDQFGRHRWYTTNPLNGSGIDLADGVFWYGLGSPEWVDWEFTEDLPMVKRVILTQSDKTIYDSQTGISSPAKAGLLSFKIIFSETMKTQGLPMVTFGLNSPYTTYSVISIKWSRTTYENDTWEGIFTIPEGQSNQYDGQNHIRIIAKDLGNNEIDSDENTSSYNPGPDTQHTFLIDTTTPEAKNVDAVLVIDRSGSMWGEKIASAKSAAKQFVDFMEQGDKIGVVDFDDIVTVTYPLTQIDEQSTVKTGAKNAIDTLWARGMTSIGGGLQKGQEELDNRGSPEHPWAIVLLSDGLQNTSPMVEDVLPDIEKKKTNVYTIAFGSDADEALMQRIANRTGGKYYFSPSAQELQGVYNKIKQAVKREKGIITKFAIIQKDETKIEKVNIDPTIKQATFGIDWLGSELNLTLTTPQGIVITPDSATENPGITFISGPTYKYYTIESPVFGEWQLNIRAIDVPQEGETYTVRVSGVTNLSLNTYFNKDEYQTGEIIGILASLSDEQGPITNATIEVIVQAPQQALSQWKEIRGDRAPTIPLREKISTIKSKALKSQSKEVFYLYDDGLHNDGEANDGVYGNIYTNTLNDGTYIFNFQAFGKTSQGYSFTREEQSSLFVKQAAQTTSISGTIFYQGTEQGPIYIQAWQNDPTMYGSPDYIGSITTPGSYTLSNLIEGTYFLSAYLDSNKNKVRDTNEPYGVYGSPTGVVISEGSEIMGIDITLRALQPNFAKDNTSAFCYPNPWCPKYGGYIYFTQVSQGSVIKIYDIAGTLIDEIKVTEHPQRWNVKSKNIASGVYIYTITGGAGGKKVGKLGIIK